MLADSQIDATSGQFAGELHLSNEARHHLFGFVNSQLSHWRSDPIRRKETSETKLTSGLCTYLNSAARFHDSWNRVNFQVEEPDEAKGSRHIDLVPKPCGSVILIEGKKHTIYDILFPIECKILPTPNGKVAPKGKDRDQREYVFSSTSSTGGIHRFKEGHHGSTHNFGGMIGYIQDRDCSHWANQVNAWIDELADSDDPIWTKQDRITRCGDDDNSNIFTGHSNHCRRSQEENIELMHSWIVMN